MRRGGLAAMLVNLAGFQAGWFACVLGAAAGRPLVGPAAVAAIVVGQMAWRRERIGDLPLLAAAGAIGWAFDAALVGLGAMSFPPEAAGPGPTPPWMVALWVNLAATLRVSLRWLHGRPLLAAALGAAGGPLAYGTGAKLGAIDLGSSPAIGLAAIGLAWLVAMPLLAWLARPRRQRGPQRGLPPVEDLTRGSPQAGRPAEGAAP